MESIVLQASIVKIKMWLDYRKEQKSFSHFFSRGSSNTISCVTYGTTKSAISDEKKQKIKDYMSSLSHNITLYTFHNGTFTFSPFNPFLVYNNCCQISR